MLRLKPIDKQSGVVSMAKIKIDGHDIEADEGLIRRLIFGTEGGKRDRIEPKIRVNEPLEALAVMVEPEAKTCKYCRKPLGTKKKFLCGDLACVRKNDADYKKKLYRKEKKVVVVREQKEKLCKVCKKPLGKKKKLLCGNHECWKINHRKANDKYYEKTHPAKNKVVVVNGNKLCRVCNNPLPKSKIYFCSLACVKKSKSKRSLEYYYKHKESVLDKIHEKRLKQIVVVKQKPKTEETKPLDRRSFITKRAKDICKYQQVSYERAVAMANQEWEGFQIKKLKGQANSSDEEFPKFENISETGLGILESIFRHTIGVKGKITYFDLIHSVSLKNELVWSGRIWGAFVAEALVKSKRILNYFSVKGNFVQVIDGAGHQYLKYED